MKKLLTYIIVIVGILIGQTAFAQNTGTIFNIDDNFFEITNFSANDYSSIHFGTGINGNSFGGAIFWGPKIDKDISLNINGNLISCKKQMRGFYVNQARGNIMRPLDNTTLWTFKGKLNGYQKLSINGGFFTNCIGDGITDYNGIYGYIKHYTTDGQEYELRAGFDYKNGIIGNKWGDSLGQELNINTKEFYIKGVLYDSYGGLGFIDSEFSNPLIIRNTSGGTIDFNLKSQPQTTSLGGNIKFEIKIDNKFDYFIENIKIYVIIPENIDGNRNNFGDFSGNKLILYEGPLYPLQSRTFLFEGEAIKPGNYTVTGVFQSYGLDITDIESIATGFIKNTKIVLNQKTTATKDTIIEDDLTFNISLINQGNVSGEDILLLDYLPNHFIYTDTGFSRYDKEKNIILLYSGNLYPGDEFTGNIKGYFDKSGEYKNIVKVNGSGFDKIVNDLSVTILTNVCGDGILDKEYEYCDDGDDNGKYGYCNKKCTDIVGAGIACKYTDANYLNNGPFTDTLNHWGFNYIETMRKSCLHRGKWNFAKQWRYDPDEYITKAEVLKTLVKIRGIAFDDFNIINEDNEYDGVQVFADVSKKHWFSWYAFYAFDNGITDGLFTQNGNKRYLSPDGKITRNEIIKAIMVLYKEIIDNKDIDIRGKSKMIDIAEGSSYYYKYIREAEELGIISGYDMPNGKKAWGGNNPLTRAEFAKIISIPFEKILFNYE